MAVSGPVSASRPPRWSKTLQGARSRRQAWAVILLTVVAAAVSAISAAGLWGQLVNGGFDAQQTEAARADSFAAAHHAGEPRLTLVVRANASVDAPAAALSGQTLAERVARTPGVASVNSYWTWRDPLLRSPSGDTALITVTLRGTDDQQVRTARTLVPKVVGRQGAVSVGATGWAWMAAEVVHGSERDMLRAELLTAPLVFAMLLLAFRSPTAALLPVAVAGISSLVTLAVLRPLASVVDLSVFSPNLATALGFGLAVDYCLFLLTRFRREVAAGRSVPAAVEITVRSAGRTVLFSTVAVAGAMACLFVFPVPFLRSMAWAGITVAMCSGTVCLLLVPAILHLAGGRLAGGRRGQSRWRRPTQAQKPTSGGWEESPGWRRLAVRVCRRPALSLAAALAVLGVATLPLNGLKVAPIDKHTLPASASSHAVAAQLDSTFPLLSPGTTATVALPYADRDDGQALATYARRLSTLPAVTTVVGAMGRYQGGRQTTPAPSSTVHRGKEEGAKGTVVSVAVAAEAGSATAANTLRAVRQLAAPPGGTVWVGGEEARFLDTTHALRRGLVPAAGWAVAGMALLLVLFTRSVLLPVKAIAVAALSLGASLGTVVLVFQYGFGANLLGMTARTGPIDACMVILALCGAFALSMDYEVFLLSHVQEEHLRGADDRAAVTRGLEQTGRLVTCAALTLTVSVGALTTSDIGLLKILGFALAVAVVIDATVVRGVLVPAAMCLAGRANWWAPAPLHRLLAGLDLHGPAAPARAVAPAAGQDTPSDREAVAGSPDAAAHLTGTAG